MARSRYEYLLTIESRPMTKMETRHYLHATLIPLDQLYYIRHNSKFLIVRKRRNIEIKRQPSMSFKQHMYFKNKRMIKLTKKHGWRVCAIEHLFKILYKQGKTKWAGKRR